MNLLPDICSCDVVDKEALAVFRMKLGEWREALIGDDEHSISRQLNRMLFDDAIFRTINEGRRLVVEESDEAKGFNRSLAGLFDRGFVASQIMAVRRLTDPGSLDSNRAVTSLVFLLDDMCRNDQLLTREHFICYDGTPFERVARASDDVEQLHWERRQSAFDRLCGVGADVRRRPDKVDARVLPALRQRLTVCDDFRTYANKFIAHAAAPSAKRDTTREDARITLDKFNEALRSMVEVASFIGASIFYEHSVGQIPVPQYDHLEGLDRPLILPHEMNVLSDYWHKRVQEVEKWGSNPSSDGILP